MTFDERCKEMEQAMSEMTQAEIVALISAAQKVSIVYAGIDQYIINVALYYNAALPVLNPDTLSVQVH